MTDKLISMVDFVLELNEIPMHFPGEVSERLNQYVKYAKFLKQPLTLGMFVPVSEAGEVLEDPNINDFKSEPFCTTGDCKAYRDELDIYNKAKSRCLFEGFTYNDRELFLDGKLIWFGELKGIVEEFVQLGLTLTPYAKELIYGKS